MTETPPDPAALQQRLRDLTGVPYRVHRCERASSGFANTTWLVDADPEPLAVKVQKVPSVVYGRDPALEPAVLEALAATPIPVPELRAVDPGSQLFGRPWFAMLRIDGRSMPDDPWTAYAAEGWFADADPTTRATIWNGFVDCLADLHRQPPATFGPSPRGGSHTQVLEYFETSLGDGGSAAPTPRQEHALAWLRDHAPDDADELRRPCMGDARMANVIERGGAIAALVDWELAYVGNPCGDLGYHLYLDGRYATVAGGRPTGLPSSSDTWHRWATRTGFTVQDPVYWEIFGAMILCVTATRGLRHAYGRDGVDLENIHPFLADIEQLIAAYS